MSLCHKLDTCRHLLIVLEELIITRDAVCPLPLELTQLDSTVFYIWLKTFQSSPRSSSCPGLRLQEVFKAGVSTRRQWKRHPRAMQTADDLLCPVAELEEEVERLRSVRGWERLWWSHTLPSLREMQWMQTQHGSTHSCCFICRA